MAKMGRPLKDIDKKTFEKLCALQCTEEEIAGWFNCHIDTICNWCKREYGKTFSEIYKEKRELGKISLRRAQWKLAEKNASMAIFLGKNYLGQSDRQELDVSGNDLTINVAPMTAEDVEMLRAEDEE